MAERAFPRTSYTQGSEIGAVYVAGEEAEFVFGKGTQILPTLGSEIYGRTATRVANDAGERWFEVGFRMDHLLTGNAASGWTDAGNYFRMEIQWGTDLVNWAMGKFLPAPVPVVDLGGGLWEYWSRAINPIDSAVKSGSIIVQSPSAGYGSSDVRNNPFTALTIAGVSLPLGGFPYTMPGDAARMQADLQAFYQDATVVATSGTAWSIAIPQVSQTSYAQTSQVFWPVYYVADMFGVVNQPVDSWGFQGQFVDAAGIAIVQKAFARYKITRGARYDPYL